MKRVLLIILFSLITVMQSCYAADDMHWDNPQRIKVYIHNSPDKQTAELINLAFQEWMLATKNKVKFIFCESEKESDIDVEFVEKPTEYGDSTVVQGTTRKSHYKDSNLYAHVTISIATQDFDGKKLAIEIIYGTMVHEIGHAIGLHDHSQNIKSVMFKYCIDNVEQNITDEELNRLKVLYKF